MLQRLTIFFYCMSCCWYHWWIIGLFVRLLFMLKRFIYGSQMEFSINCTSVSLQFFKCLGILMTEDGLTFLVNWFPLDCNVRLIFNGNLRWWKKGIFLLIYQDLRTLKYRLGKGKQFLFENGATWYFSSNQIDNLKWKFNTRT